jgi:hypothetical protein
LPPAPSRTRSRVPEQCGAVAEWSKALAWKVSIRQKRIVGSNPTRSATPLFSRSFPASGLDEERFSVGFA